MDTRLSLRVLGHGRAIAFAVGLLLASAAHAQTFSNTTPITILDISAASPYPSAISVSGVTGSVERLSVTISGFIHTYPGDVGIVLVSPSGRGVLLMGACGGGTDVVGATLTFSDSATSPLPSPIVSGVYMPSNCFGATMPAPGPMGPFFSDLAAFQGENPNGTWKLYVADSALGDTGSITSGWSISFHSQATTPTAAAFTYQGVLTDNDAPLTGPVDAKFYLYTAQTGGTRIGAPLHQALNASNGLLTTWLDFGDDVLSASEARWLEVTVNGQAQSPRQRLMNAPTATKARYADTAGLAATATLATTATTAQSVPWSGITGVPANVSNAYSPWMLNGNNILYSAGAVTVGNNNVIGQLNIGATGPNAVYQTSTSPTGTWSIFHNDTTSTYWQIIATGTGSAGGPGDLMITSGTGPGSSANQSIRFLGSNGYVGIGLPYGTLPSQRLTVNGNVLANNVAVPSSIRFKDHVVPMDDALARLLKLEGVRFDWKPEWAKERPGREHDIGFVAEDVAKEFPEVVFYDADGNVTGMDYSRMTAVAIEAIKQQQAQLVAQQDQIGAQKAKFDAELAKRDAELARRDAEEAELRARLDRLEKALETRH